MPEGRPTEYDPEIAAAICAEISVSTKSLKAICDSQEYFPTFQKFYHWMIEHAEAQELYARAKEAQTQLIEDEMLAIADDGSNDLMETKFGPKADREVIQRSQLRIDTRKWLMSKLKPKKYGDKVAHVGGGPGDEPLAFTVRSILEEPPSKKLGDGEEK